MGSWNGTCALSNLSINCGDDIVLVMLTKHPSSDDNGAGFCYTQLDWHPLFVPIRGKYNDYGGIEDFVEGPHTEYLLKHFADEKNFKIISRKFDKEHGANDHPPFTSLDKLFKCIERGYMRIPQNVMNVIRAFDDEGNSDDENTQISMSSQLVPVGYMMMLAEVHDALISTAGSFDRLLTRINADCARTPDFMQSMYIGDDETLTKADEISEAKKAEINRKYFVHCVKRDTCSEGERWSLLKYVPETNEELFQIPKLNSLLLHLRKFYSIQAGSGSSDQNEDSISTLMKATKAVIKRRALEDAEQWDDVAISEGLLIEDDSP